ncbi:hypothetical protein [Aeromicrobium fastidiosum]|uniref:Uncharacterized protein n=1 Tax=Aeromicrobium fastidiosum TaxID=52699 RepID=A0A641ALQ9_9ACTN|nr:hypothetical protein [Aeromicrobium fastidiosum]KAA1378220.1 hypothetical protein ESP62_007515 [Aeromicrobium fastidiosum]MBP2388970.1 hypothetical protein [Aeromicrobium fastidiosum]
MAFVVLTAGAACDADGGTGGPRRSCEEADPAVVKQIMAGAKTNFRPTPPDGGTGVLVDHLELLKSGVGQLPEKDRKFGADQLVVLLVTTVLGGKDASGGISGYDGPLYFALDADGKLLGPAGEFTASHFNLESPADAGWLAWGDKVETSKLGNDLFGCVDPD